jgi:hypothetical protein
VALRRASGSSSLPLGSCVWKRGGAGPSLTPDPEQEPLTRLAFELYSTGLYSKREVLRRVTDMGLSRRCRAVSPQTLSALLANPIYAGRIVSPGFGTDGPGDFESIIDQETLDEVQKVSQSIRARSPVANSTTGVSAPASRSARVCSTPLSGSRPGGGRRSTTPTTAVESRRALG